jgi:signal transduction histidine kinase
VSTSTIPVTLSDRGLGRQDESIEAALYFCCIEAVQNAVKHSAASRIDVDLDTIDGIARLVVRDDGVGFDPGDVSDAGGLGNMRDRIDAAGGELAIRPRSSRGTEVIANIPLSRPPERS